MLADDLELGRTYWFPADECYEGEKLAFPYVFVGETKCNKVIVNGHYDNRPVKDSLVFIGFNEDLFDRKVLPLLLDPKSEKEMSEICLNESDAIELCILAEEEYAKGRLEVTERVRKQIKESKGGDN